MSKAQYILLFAIVGYYALLFVSLIIRACAAFWQAGRTRTPKPRKTSGILTRNDCRSWTRAVRHEKLA
jgi:hypothetical protein